MMTGNTAYSLTVFPMDSNFHFEDGTLTVKLKECEKKTMRCVDRTVDNTKSIIYVVLPPIDPDGPERMLAIPPKNVRLSLCQTCLYRYY